MGKRRYILAASDSPRLSLCGTYSFNFRRLLHQLWRRTCFRQAHHSLRFFFDSSE